MLSEELQHRQGDPCGADRAPQPTIQIDDGLAARVEAAELHHSIAPKRVTEGPQATHVQASGEDAGLGIEALDLVYREAQVRCLVHDDSRSCLHVLCVGAM